jgi:endo-1,4-beta-xylanase
MTRPDLRFTFLLAVALFLGASTFAVAQEGGTTILNAGFESGTAEGWIPRGTETVAATTELKRTGAYSLKVSKRTLTWNGALHELPEAPVRGVTYRISAWVTYIQGPATGSIVLSVEKSYTDAAAAHRYENVKSVVVNKGEWTLLQADYTVPGEDGLKTIDIYFETPYKQDSQVTADDTHDIYVDDVRVARLAAADMVTIQQDIPNLHSVLDPYFAIGAAVPPRFVDPENIHSRLLLKHFTALVAGNAMKPDALQPTEGTFNWVDADRIVRFGNATGMRVRGHTLLWHNQIPAWFFTDPKDPQKPASRELLLARLKTHIQTVVGHFKGDIDSWDVVNEVLSDRKGLRGGDEGSRWLGIIGPDYIDKAFQFAREADPKAKLVINDYNLESDQRKRDEMVSLVRGMLARNVPVDAVGMQMHISITYPSIAEIRRSIEAFAALGVKVQITEMDVSIYSGSAEAMKTPDAQTLQAQGRRYQELFDLFKEEAKKGIIDMVVLWGVADDDTWLDSFPVPGRLNAPLLFDRSLQAKPAFWGIVDPSRMR